MVAPLLALLLTSCDHFPHDAYFVGQKEMFKSARQKQELCNLLRESVRPFGLESTVHGGTHKNVLCQYGKDMEGFPLFVGARQINDETVVDISAFNRTKEFNAIKTVLVPANEKKYPETALSEYLLTKSGF